MNQDIPNNDGAEKSEAARSRRDFVKLAGKVAVYTPPVMLGLSAPSVHAISKSAIGSHRRNEKPRIRGRVPKSKIQNRRMAKFFRLLKGRGFFG